jgi:hypothetical protein
VPRQSRLTEIHAVAPHRDSFSKQQLTLEPSFREASVGADDAMPRQAFVRAGQHATDEARRAGVDIAIRADESLRDVLHAGDDSPDA